MTLHISWSRHNVDGTHPNIQTHGQATFRFQRRSRDQCDRLDCFFISLISMQHALSLVL